MGSSIGARVLWGVWYYVFGHLIAFLTRYDKKYLTGRWFSGRANGLCSKGWRWVVHDALGCLNLNVNKNVPWPVSPRCTVICPENIRFHADDLNNFQSFGIYFQGYGGICIGKGTYIGPNVGLITANHDVGNPEKHVEPAPIILGESCWIGMNSVILPGIVLGDFTTVGAGSIVTKSFPEGHCVIAGNPAKIIKKTNNSILNDDNLLSSEEYLQEVLDQ